MYIGMFTHLVTDMGKIGCGNPQFLGHGNGFIEVEMGNMFFLRRGI